ncbi:type VI secretion lipoprotein TssJ [Candidatus Methylospira mobilis]|uniref:Type VI secretion lipoprotein TssJ n=1 Tax=Candidatus Methylospira mobilis TaxID=1808979 RepID=A0A5Q0BHE6_9GAMM|nr:type VI secretion lipoprotein TssJ [Candidatus Methylospira mobilis]QFY41584.1 type VI secretion lipoprotein TssJ [Candidatus Methylospira mobilis]
MAYRAGLRLGSSVLNNILCWRFFLLSIGYGLMLCGCSTTAGPSPQDQAKLSADWAYRADGIKLYVASSGDMNNWDGEAHTVALAIIQMDDPAEFTRISTDRAALLQLINEGKAPLWSVQLSRYVINPGVKTASVTLARAQKTKHFGIVAGYYDFDASQDVKFFSIPLKLKEEDSGFVARPAQVRVAIQFGRQQIVSSTLTSIDEYPDVPLTPGADTEQEGQMPVGEISGIYPIRE